MPFRSIVAEPEQLAKLSLAFDQAWVEINRRTPIEAEAKAVARERLGSLLVSLWQNHPGSDLASLAVIAYFSRPKAVPGEIVLPPARKAEEL